MPRESANRWRFSKVIPDKPAIIVETTVNQSINQLYILPILPKFYLRLPIILPKFYLKLPIILPKFYLRLPIKKKQLTTSNCWSRLQRPWLSWWKVCASAHAASNLMWPKTQRPSARTKRQINPQRKKNWIRKNTCRYWWVKTKNENSKINVNIFPVEFSTAENHTSYLHIYIYIFTHVRRYTNFKNRQQISK